MSIPEFKTLDEIKKAPTTALDCALEKIARLEAENARLKNGDTDLHHQVSMYSQMISDRDEETLQSDLDNQELENAFDEIIDPTSAHTRWTNMKSKFYNMCPRLLARRLAMVHNCPDSEAFVKKRMIEDFRLNMGTEEEDRRFIELVKEGKFKPQDPDGPPLYLAGVRRGSMINNLYLKPHYNTHHTRGHHGAGPFRPSKRKLEGQFDDAEEGPIYRRALIDDSECADKLRSAPVIGKDVYMPGWLSPFNYNSKNHIPVPYAGPSELKEHMADKEKVRELAKMGINLPFGSARLGPNPNNNSQALARRMYTEVEDTDDMSKKPKKARTDPIEDMEIAYLKELMPSSSAFDGKDDL